MFIIKINPLNMSQDYNIIGDFRFETAGVRGSNSHLIPLTNCSHNIACSNSIACLIDGATQVSSNHLYSVVRRRMSGSGGALKYQGESTDGPGSFNMKSHYLTPIYPTKNIQELLNELRVRVTDIKEINNPWFTGQDEVLIQVNRNGSYGFCKMNSGTVCSTETGDLKIEVDHSHFHLTYIAFGLRPGAPCPVLKSIQIKKNMSLYSIYMLSAIGVQVVTDETLTNLQQSRFKEAIFENINKGHFIRPDMADVDEMDIDEVPNHYFQFSLPTSDPDYESGRWTRKVNHREGSFSMFKEIEFGKTYEAKELIDECFISERPEAW